MGVGKKIRLNSVINPETGKVIIVPMDHGVSSGPIEGIVNIKEAVQRVAEGGADAVVIHKGNVRLAFGEGRKNIGLIVHISASTDWSPRKNDKVLVGAVEEALKLGADMVSIHVNMGAEGEREMLRDFGAVSRACEDWQIPLLAMIYGRGPKIENQYDPKVVAHCARLGAELGADIVKVPYTGDPETFAKVVEGAGIPVVIAGGPKAKSVADVLKMVEGAIKAGGAGLSIGRNVFQADDPAKMVRAMRMIVHEGKTAEEALQFLNS
jgi:class I fructose-bisphosphate aldolase